MPPMILNIKQDLNLQIINAIPASIIPNAQNPQFVKP